MQLKIFVTKLEEAAYWLKRLSEDGLKCEENMKWLALFFVMFIWSADVLAKEVLQVVPNKKVCMVTNMVFPRDQIPVIHSGKTYYGCCENCKKTLAEDASARSAIDPVTKKSIDKSKAVIGARDDGSVVYFENQANMQKYIKDSK